MLRWCVPIGGVRLLQGRATRWSNGALLETGMDCDRSVSGTAGPDEHWWELHLNSNMSPAPSPWRVGT